jgi:minor extracellular serine protease Vpr
VAPQCTLGAYRVFSCSGSAPDDVIVKAMLRAAEDGMDVINLSLGGPGGWSQDREARVIDLISQKFGILVVAAAGNEGDLGAFQMGSPGVSRSAIAVSSNENPYVSEWYFSVRGNNSKGTTDGQQRKIVFLGDEVMDLNATLAQTAPGTSGNVTADACDPISTDIQGKIAVVRRGDCTFAQKLRNLVKAKAKGVIIMNNVQGEPAVAVDKSGVNIPVRSISRQDGEYLLQQMQNNNGVRIEDGSAPVTFKNPIGGQLSSFTSLGPDSELNLKPDITAPGGNIWSTYPLPVRC